jgi:glycosyltransferase involved in cell wall biosynthesis
MRPRPLVLIDADTIGRARTGDESYTVNLLRELPEVAPDLAFAASLRDPDAMPADVPPSVRRLAMPVASPYRRIPFSVPRLALDQHAALLHVQYFVALRLAMPCVVTVHDLSFTRQPELFGRRDRLLLGSLVPGSVRRARRVIAVSEFTRGDLIDRYGLQPEQVVAIRNGVSPRFHPDPDAAAVARAQMGLERPFVLFVGALQPRKNATALVDAFARLRDHPELELVIAGGDRGGLAEVQERIAAHGLGTRVRLVGHVSEDALPGLYNAAELLAFPSLYEGFGLPALEAMACGTPVCASSTTGLGEAVGEAGLTFDPRSPEEIAICISRLLEDRTLRSRLWSAGLARAASFTWRRSADATAVVYREALA